MQTALENDPLADEVPYQEYKRGTERYRDWFDPPLSIADGALCVPTGPGVGIVNLRELLKEAQAVL